MKNKFYSSRPSIKEELVMLIYATGIFVAILGAIQGIRLIINCFTG